MRKIVWLVLVLIAMDLPAESDFFVEYLYIEAGEGDSSGGHVAIQFSEDVYHYQYFNGLLRAVRESAKNFEYRYRFLGNRTIHASKITISEESYHHLQSFFNHKYRLQTRQFKVINLIMADIALIRELREGGKQKNPENNFRPLLKGAALFSRSNQPSGLSPAISLPSPVEFLQWIRRKYGPSFIADRIARTQQELASLQVTGWNTRHVQFSEDRYPVLPYSLAEHFVDLLGNLTALEVIQSGVSLSSSARIESNFPGFRLHSEQIEGLRRYQKKLQQDLLKLIASTRPDWGYPLIVGLARLIVLDESIRTRKLVLLDTFRRQPERVDLEDIDRYRDTFKLLHSEARSNFEKEKEKLLGQPRMDESEYSVLEMLGNRYAELARGVVDGKTMRIHDGDLAPPAIGEIPIFVRPRISDSGLLDELSYLSDFASRYSGRMEAQYRYNLLTRNCVSEIFRNIESALENRSEGFGHPGSTGTEFNPLSGGTAEYSFWNSVPFISSVQVQRNFAATDSRILLSYRQNRLKEMYDAENPLMAYFRESNLLTSTLYIWNPNDSFFLFFTDDSILPRPVFGAFNTVAGIAQTLMGVFMSPVDGGDVFISGIKGFLVSLPELAFFNMRKGSYRYPPYDYLMDQSESAF